MVGMGHVVVYIRGCNFVDVCRGWEGIRGSLANLEGSVRMKKEEKLKSQIAILEEAIKRLDEFADIWMEEGDVHEAEVVRAATGSVDSLRLKLKRKLEKLKTTK